MNGSFISPLRSGNAAGMTLHTGSLFSAQIAQDLQGITDQNAALLRQNAAASVSSAEDRSESPFFSSALPSPSAEGNYVIDGVCFSREELAQCRLVLQTAASGIETSGTIDYLPYAQMSIAKNAVQSFANTHLSEEQSAVLTRGMQEYCDEKIAAEQQLLSDGAYTPSDAGALSEYYGVQKTYSKTELTAINALIDEMNRVSGGHKSHVESDFASLTTSATNSALIGRIDALFAHTDLSDPAASNAAMEQYKALMTPVYLAAGIDRTHGALARVLDAQAAKLTAFADSIALCGRISALDVNV